MAKTKLKKFAEINSFSNVIQPPSPFDLTHFELRGKWNESFFGNTSPIVLEIGCGKGEYTIGLARAYPKVNFIGIDIKGDRIWNGARQALDEGLQNVAFLRIQAESIANYFDQNEVDGIWLTFPDPQPRKTRQRKRLSSPTFLHRYSLILKPGAPIHLKTDNADLFAYTLDVINQEKHTLITAIHDLYGKNVVNETMTRDIQTYYEKKYLEQGLPIHYLKFCLHEPGKS